MDHFCPPQTLAGETERPVNDWSLGYRKTVQLAYVLVLVLLAIFLIVQSRPLNPRWTGTHWLFTYEFGFIKRGLVGTLVSPILALSTFEQLDRLSVATGVVTLTAFIWWILRPLWPEGLSLHLTLWFMLSILHSGTLQNFWYDPLRFDQINLWILLTALAVTAKARFPISTVAVGVLGGVSLLVHEAAFFTTIPVMLGALLLRVPVTSSGSGWRQVGALAMLFTISTWIIGVYGRLPMEWEAYLTHLQSRVEFGIEAPAIMVLTSSLGEDIQFALSHLTRRIVLQGHVLLTFLMLPTAVVFIGLFRDLCTLPDPPLPKRLGLLFLAALGPLALYGVGLDFFRWWALATVNAFVVTAWLCRVRPDCVGIIEQGVRSRRIWVIAAIVVSILFGPMGVYYGFPEAIWENLSMTSVSSHQ